MISFFQGNRFYVGTDTLGSPLAVFKANGQLLKQVDRTPYGRTTHDSNPTLRLFIDFNGGLINEHTRYVVRLFYVFVAFKSQSFF